MRGRSRAKDRKMIKDLYEAIGGSYETALGRLMKDSLVEKFVMKFPNDPTFGELEQSLAAKDWDTAFRAAHTLKGVAMNLAFVKLAATATALTDTLRPQNKDVFDESIAQMQFDLVKEDYNKVIEEIGKL